MFLGMLMVFGKNRVIRVYLEDLVCLVIQEILDKLLLDMALVCYKKEIRAILGFLVIQASLANLVFLDHLVMRMVCYKRVNLVVLELLEFLEFLVILVSLVH